MEKEDRPITEQEA